MSDPWNENGVFELGLWTDIREALRSYCIRKHEVALSALFVFIQKEPVPVSLKEAPSELTNWLLAHVGVYNNCRNRELMEIMYKDAWGFFHQTFWEQTVYPPVARNFMCDCITYSFHPMLNFEVGEARKRFALTTDPPHVEIKVNQYLISQARLFGVGRDSLIQEDRIRRQREMANKDILQVREALGRRIHLALSILMRISCSRENAEILAKNATVLRGVAVLVHCSWENLRELALNLLLNVAEFIDLKEASEVPALAIIYAVIHENFLSRSRRLLFISVQILSQWFCLNRSAYTNYDEFPVNLRMAWRNVAVPHFIPRLYQLLSVPDSALIIVVLECMFRMSTHGRFPCDKLCSTPEAVKSLVLLLFAKESDFGKLCDEDEFSQLAVRSYVKDHVNIPVAADGNEHIGDENGQLLNAMERLEFIPDCVNIKKPRLTSSPERKDVPLIDVNAVNDEMKLADTPTTMCSLVSQLQDVRDRDTMLDHIICNPEALPMQIFESDSEEDSLSIPRLILVDSVPEPLTVLTDAHACPKESQSSTTSSDEGVVLMEFIVSDDGTLTLLKEERLSLVVPEESLPNHSQDQVSESVKEVVSELCSCFPNITSKDGTKFTKCSNSNSIADDSADGHELKSREKKFAYEYIENFYELDDSSRAEFQEMYKAYSTARLSLGPPVQLVCPCEFLTTVDTVFGTIFKKDDRFIGGVHFLFLMGLRVKQKASFKLSHPCPATKGLKTESHMMTSMYGKFYSCPTTTREVSTIIRPTGAAENVNKSSHDTTSRYSLRSSSLQQPDILDTEPPSKLQDVSTLKRKGSGLSLHSISPKKLNVEEEEDEAEAQFFREEMYEIPRASKEPVEQSASRSNFYKVLNQRFLKLADPNRNKFQQLIQRSPKEKTVLNIFMLAAAVMLNLVRHSTGGRSVLQPYMSVLTVIASQEPPNSESSRLMYTIVNTLVANICAV